MRFAAESLQSSNKKQNNINFKGALALGMILNSFAPKCWLTSTTILCNICDTDIPDMSCAGGYASNFTNLPPAHHRAYNSTKFEDVQGGKCILLFKVVLKVCAYGNMVWYVGLCCTSNLYQCGSGAICIRKDAVCFWMWNRIRWKYLSLSVFARTGWNTNLPDPV